MAPVLMQRSVASSRTLCRVPFTAHASLKAGRASTPKEDEIKPGHALLAATLTASMLMEAGLVIPEQAHAAGSAGRASVNKFRSRREAAAPQVNNYSFTTIVQAAPPVVVAPPLLAPPVVVAPPSTFGISIVPVIPIPIPLPNPFASPAPAPAPVPVASAESAAAAEAAAAATAAAAAATAAAAAVVAAAK